MCTQIRMCVQLENDTASKGFLVTKKTVLSGHSKVDKKQVLMTNGSLMKVKTIPLKTGFTVFNLIFGKKCRK